MTICCVVHICKEKNAGISSTAIAHSHILLMLQVNGSKNNKFWDAKYKNVLLSCYYFQYRPW